MKNEVFKSMINDKTGKVAKRDPLIVALGESWPRNNISNTEKRRYYASQCMRLLGKMIPHVNNMESCEGSDILYDMRV